MRPDVGRFFCRFDHQHDVLHRVKAVKSGRGFIKLIAQNQDEVTTRYCLHTAIMLNDWGVCMRPDFSTCLPWAYYFLPAAVVSTAPFFWARHASEQYLMSPQFLAQLLRQVISRPQTMQILLGSAALLPLKPLKTMRRTPLLAEGVVVVVRIGAVVAAPQLHRHILVGVGNPLDA